MSLRKKAGVYSDAIYGAVPTIATDAMTGGLASLVGLGHGLLASDEKPLQQLREMENKSGRAFVPGLNASRGARRSRIIGRLLENPQNGDVPLTYHRLGGAFLNPVNLALSPITIPAAAIAAAATKGHSVAERRKALNDPNARLKTWLIPGYGMYQSYKDLGLSHRLGKMNPVQAQLAVIDPTTAGLTGGGALAGGLVGGLASKENKLRNAVLGAALGAGAGYGVDYLRRRNPREVAKLRKSVKNKLSI